MRNSTILMFIMATVPLISIAGDSGDMKLLTKDDQEHLTQFFLALNINSYITFSCFPENRSNSHSGKKCSATCGDTNQWSRNLSLGVSSDGTQYYYTERGLISSKQGNCILNGFKAIGAVTNPA